MHISNEIVQACIRQDRTAQQQLYKLLLPCLHAVTERYLLNPSYWKDALQEAFVKIFRHLDKYDPQQASLKTWATRITINTAINYNRKFGGISQEEIGIQALNIPVQAEVLQKYTDESLLFMLKQLPPAYLEVFNLFVIDGYSHEEIAGLLGINEDLSRQRLSRAKSMLRKLIEKNDKYSSVIEISVLLLFTLIMV